jgi:hypothetical protein
VCSTVPRWTRNVSVPTIVPSIANSTGIRELHSGASIRKSTVAPGAGSTTVQAAELMRPALAAVKERVARIARRIAEN